MANTQTFEVDNILNINNNNKIIGKSHARHSTIRPTANGNRSDDAADELKSPESMAKEPQRSADEIGAAYITPTMVHSTLSNRVAAAAEQRTLPPHLRNKGEGSRIARYGKVNGASLSQMPSNANNNNNNNSTNNNNNIEGSYHCQFCDKSFPRLGYLKKHEQVSA